MHPDAPTHAMRRPTRSISPGHALHETAVSAVCNLMRGLARDDRTRASLLELPGNFALARAALGYEKLPATRSPVLRRLAKVAGAPVRKLEWPRDALGANLRLLARQIGLTDAEVELVEYALCVTEYPGFDDVHRAVETAVGDVWTVLGYAVGADPRQVRVTMAPRARLATSGLLDVDDDNPWTSISMTRSLVDVLMTPDLPAGGLLEAILPVADDSELTLGDFEHLRDDVPMLRDLLAAAVRARATGVNVLLHGPTGAGKTALATALARAIGATPYVAGREGRDGGNLGGEERFASLRMGQQLLAGSDSVLVFDELEDLFAGDDGPMQPWRRPGRGISKQVFNRTLESNAVPTVWITNSVERLDAAYRRRFSHSVEMRPPGRRQRERVVRRVAGRLGLEVPPEAASRLARHDVSAAQLATGLRTVQLAHGGFDAEAARRVLARSERLASGHRRREEALDRDRYRADVLETSMDLGRLVNGLERWRPGAGPGPALLLWGAPGTGKTEFARQLAHRLDRALLVQRCSDLLSKFVGETEERIAEAFRRADDEDALLLFDEADSFLGDRAQALQRWEITETNEFLQQLERHPGIVACTTNRLDALDPAALRRFSHKVEFRPLRPSGALVLLREAAVRAGFDATHLAEETVARLGALTPGDFSAMERRIAQCGGAQSLDELLEALRDEAASRDRGRRLGF